jgi:hypothetical protein
MIHEHNGAKRLRMRDYVTNNSGRVIIGALLVAHMQRTVRQTGSEAYFARDPRTEAFNPLCCFTVHILQSRDTFALSKLPLDNEKKLIKSY